MDKFKDYWNNQISEYKKINMFKEIGNSLEIFNTFNYNQHTVTIESTEGFFQVLEGNLKYNSNGYYTIEVSWIKQFKDINQFILRIYIKNIEASSLSVGKFYN